MAKSYDPYTKLRIYYILDEYTKKDSNEDYILELMDGLPDDQISVKDKNNTSILSYAIHYNHFRVARQLLSNPNTDPNIEDMLNQMLLIIAMRNNHETTFPNINNSTHSNNYEIIKLIMDHPKFNINKQNSNGDTVLHIAIFCYQEYVDLLLDHPLIDVNIKNNKSQTPLMKFIDYFTIYKNIMGGKDIDTRKDGFTKLCRHPDINLYEKDDNGKDIFDMIIDNLR